MDNTQYLKDIAEAEKRAKQTELEQAKAKALGEVDKTQATTMPTFTKQKQQTNTNSQIGAKNLAEYWANRGQNNAGVMPSGIALQAEMSRENVLGRDLGTINTNETQALTGFNDARTGINTDFSNNLINTNNLIDNSLNTNLYNERIRQAEAIRQAEEQAYQRQQDAINNAQQWASINNSRPKEQPVTISTPYYQGKLNPDANNGTSTFSNGYQPNNIGGQPLSSTGDKYKFVTATLNGNKNTVSQTIWQTPDGKKWFWDGRFNSYISFNE